MSLTGVRFDQVPARFTESPAATTQL